MNQRIKDGIARAEPEDIENIITAAIKLERAYYEKASDKEFMDTVRKDQLVFTLRKALEGVWGHDLPDVIKDET